MEKTIDEVVQGQTVPKLFLNTIANHGDRVALRWKNGDEWHEMTFTELADKVARAATGLAALGLGHGDRMVMMIRNRPEFHVVDTAAMFLGAAAVSIYNSSATDQIAYLAGDAEAKIAIVEDHGFHELFTAARSGLPNLDKVVVIDDTGVADPEFTYAGLLNNEPMDLAAAAETVRPEDLATLIYTSGTTGPSKGVMLDHANVCWTVECLYRAFDIESMAGKRLVSYLPMAHIAERMTSHYNMLALALEVSTCPEPTLFAAYAGEVKPNIMFGVPRVWEKIYAGVNAAVAADPEKEKALNEAIDAAGPIAEKMTWGEASDEELETYNFLDAVAFSTVRELVGLDQLDLAITGAAPIPAEMLSWFRTIGVPLSEIYGLSETCGPMTWAPYKVKPGLVGHACPGVEVKLGEDGEVMCRGGNVFRGYLNQPEKTAEVMDGEWFKSGDIGEFDDDGYLNIVDRKKELIITAAGKNLSPSNLEAALKMIPLVGQAMAIGDQRPFVTALVVLDPDAAATWATAHDCSHLSMNELAEHSDLLAEVEAALPGAMKEFNNAEKVKKVRVLGEEWMPDSDLLTPTSKLKRRGIITRFAVEIEELYG